MLNEENQTFFLIKIKRERHDSDHIHTLWEQTDGEDGRTLSAWRRFAGRGSRLGSFNSHLFYPFDLIWKERKMPPTDPFFFPFQKACFCRVSTIVLSINDCHPDFGTVPVLPPCFSVRDLFPSGQFNSVYWTKPKTVQNVSVHPLFCVQWLLTTVSHGLSFWLVVIFRSPGSIPMRFLRKNCGDFPYF